VCVLDFFMIVAWELVAQADLESRSTWSLLLRESQAEIWDTEAV
jgi:hypothetical protein